MMSAYGLKDAEHDLSVIDNERHSPHRSQTDRLHSYIVKQDKMLSWLARMADPSLIADRLADAGMDYSRAVFLADQPRIAAEEATR